MYVCMCVCMHINHTAPYSYIMPASQPCLLTQAIRLGLGLRLRAFATSSSPVRTWVSLACDILPVSRYHCASWMSALRLCSKSLRWFWSAVSMIRPSSPKVLAKAWLTEVTYGSRLLLTHSLTWASLWMLIEETRVVSCIERQ